jgi:hypothetical protein
MLEGGTLPPAAAAYHASEAEFDELLAENAVLHLNSFAGGVSGLKASGLFGFRCRAGVSYSDKPDLLAEDLATLTETGFRTLLLCANEAEEGALCERLREAGYTPIPLAYDASLDELKKHENCVFTTHGFLHRSKIDKNHPAYNLCESLC